MVQACPKVLPMSIRSSDCRINIAVQTTLMRRQSKEGCSTFQSDSTHKRCLKCKLMHHNVNGHVLDFSRLEAEYEAVSPLGTQVRVDGQWIGQLLDCDLQ